MAALAMVKGQKTRESRSRQASTELRLLQFRNFELHRNDDPSSSSFKRSRLNGRSVPSFYDDETENRLGSNLSNRGKGKKPGLLLIGWQFERMIFIDPSIAI